MTGQYKYANETHNLPQNSLTAAVATLWGDAILEHGRHVGCTMKFGSTAKVLAKCKLKYYRNSECVAEDRHVSGGASDQAETPWWQSVNWQACKRCTMGFGSTAKLLAKCKLKYYRTSGFDARQWTAEVHQRSLTLAGRSDGSRHVPAGRHSTHVTQHAGHDCS